MKEISKKSADIKEWRKALDKDLELKFKDQTIAITEVFEEQNTKLNDKFSKMMEAHKADREASIHKSDQLTGIIQSLVQTSKEPITFKDSMQKDIEKLKINDTKNCHEQDPNKVNNQKR
eukprot:5117965-Ditylum_brightwellii.AAC.1